MTGLEARERLRAQVVLARNGDRAAFEEVFTLTRTHARKLAYSVVGPNHCEDVLQESYLLAYRKLSQLKDPDALIGWLCRLVLHVSYRYKKRHPLLEELPEQLQVQEKTDDVLQAIVLRKALNGMHTKDRDVLVLRELLGLSYEDISHALQVPVGTVRSRLNSARKRLAQQLRTRGIEAGSGQL